MNVSFRLIISLLLGRTWVWDRSGCLERNTGCSHHHSSQHQSWPPPPTPVPPCATQGPRCGSVNTWDGRSWWTRCLMILLHFALVVKQITSISHSSLGGGVFVRYTVRPCWAQNPQLHEQAKYSKICPIRVNSAIDWMVNISKICPTSKQAASSESDFPCTNQQVDSPTLLTWISLHHVPGVSLISVTVNILHILLQVSKSTENF